MNRTILLVGLGGFFGSSCRYLTALFLTKTFPSAFPYGTFAVNIIGCLLIGIFYGLSQYYNWFNANLTLLLATGFCGGFTTFSSFSYENLNLLQNGEYLTFGLYSIGSFVLGLLAVVVGLIFIKNIIT